MEQRPVGRQESNVEREDAGAVPSDEDESNYEFEFPFVSREPAADELFVGGRIRAFYPVFGRVLDDAAPGPRALLGRLFQLEEATSSSSSASTEAAAGDLDGTSPGSYCLWTPGLSLASSPSRPPRKSRFTESIARWHRIGELVVGRSHSDGKGRFLFLSAPPSPAREHASSSKANQPARGNKAAATEVDTVAAGRWMSYSAKASPGARRTFLPYRQDLVGLFGNVHGHSLSHHHPF